MAIASIVSSLSHPLLLLVAGAFLSSYLIPRFTRQWQSHQKELELKSALIREINDSTANYFGAIELIALKGKERSLAKLDEAYVTWKTSYEILTSELEAYFPRTAFIARDWNDFGSGMMAVYFLFKNKTPTARRDTLETYRGQLGAEPASLPTIVSTSLLKASDKIGAYDDELVRLFDHFRFKKQDLIRQIMKARSALSERGGPRVSWFRAAERENRDLNLRRADR